MTGAYGFLSAIKTESDTVSGSTSERYAFTNASFTMNPGAGLASSAGVNSRPRSTGMRSVRKYPGVTTRITALGRSLIGSSGVPSLWNTVPPLGEPITARLSAAAADSTPGNARMASSASR
jgi:hypothetical protein